MEFIFRLSSYGDPALEEETAQLLLNLVVGDAAEFGPYLRRNIAQQSREVK